MVDILSGTGDVLLGTSWSPPERVDGEVFRCARHVQPYVGERVAERFAARFFETA